MVELASELQRLPDNSPERLILGLAIPLVGVDPMTASAAAKVAVALDRFGLRA